MHLKSFIFATLLFSIGANGETCETLSLMKKIRDAEFIFSGKVIARKKDYSDIYYAKEESCGSKYVKFEVYTSWKGNVETGVDIYSWDACDSLGTYFDLGKDYLVFSKRNHEELVITELYGCYTETLIEAVENKSIRKLDRLYNKKSIFENSDVFGVWQSYSNSSDKGFPNVDTISFEFKRQHEFRATTLGGGKRKKYKGIFYAKGGGISLYDEDGPQYFKYQLYNGVMVLEARNGSVLYHLRKNN
jgi:hypothetical protein